LELEAEKQRSWKSRKKQGKAEKQRGSTVDKRRSKEAEKQRTIKEQKQGKAEKLRSRETEIQKNGGKKTQKNSPPFQIVQMSLLQRSPESQWSPHAVISPSDEESTSNSLTFFASRLNSQSFSLSSQKW